MLRYLLTLPSWKKNVAGVVNSKPSLILAEAKLNVLHTTYLALCYQPNLDADLLIKGKDIFQALYGNFFEDIQKVI